MTKEKTIPIVDVNAANACLATSATEPFAMHEQALKATGGNQADAQQLLIQALIANAVVEHALNPKAKPLTVRDIINPDELPHS